MNEATRIEPAIDRPGKNKHPRLPPIDLEHDLEQILQRPTPLPVVMPAAGNIGELGRMSAEAVLTQYEVAAKSVEEMGEDVKVRIQKLEAALAECHKDMTIIADCAQMIRDKGKLVQAQIEEASAVSADIREACIEFKRKMGA
ncbi:MAG TPA: hypothetical protein VFP43_22510 [Mesorhizobium sp.]|nr:hypothetical protein [Mesorhizobium sp.]